MLERTFPSFSIDLITPAPAPTPFVPGARRKSHSASYLRPGNRTANHFPSCTPKQALRFSFRSGPSWKKS